MIFVDRLGVLEGGLPRTLALSKWKVYCPIRIAGGSLGALAMPVMALGGSCFRRLLAR